MSREITLIVIGLLSIAFFAILIRERKWEKLARAERQKNILLAIISHQLRTPVTTIQWYVEMLQGDDFGAGMGGEQKNALGMVSAAMGQVIQLVGRLLETSRIEHTGIVHVPVALNIQEQVHLTLKAVEGKSNEKGHNVSVKKPDAPIQARLDPLVLHAILGVILENAIAYTPSGGRIGVELKEEGRNVVIQIEDTGPGLSLEQQETLFSSKFRREKEKLLLTSGGGIGLYLVQRLIEDIGGSIWFHSEVGKGTTFFVTLPKGKV